MKEKKYSLRGVIIAFAAGLVLALLAGGYYMLVTFGGGASLRGAEKFAVLYNLINSQFIGEVDMEQASEAAYDGLVAATGDRWSYYLTPSEYKSYMDSQNNRYIGIGVTVSKDTESSFLRIESVTDDTPAANAGLKPGELVVALDGVSLEKLEPSELKERIAEMDGRAFELTIRDAGGTERTVVLKSEKIFSDPIEYYMLPDDIGYIKIRNFDKGAASGGRAAIDELKSRGARGLVFDVRNDPGGLVVELTQLLDYLLPEGEIFISVAQNGTQAVTRSDASFTDLPMAVLINGNSYSAAEFFAAALSERCKSGFAGLVGTQTTGKSRSQVTIALSDGSALHLSTNGYLTPNGVDLAQQGGLVPDYVVELSEEDSTLLRAGRLEYEYDEQLQRAQQLVAERTG
ncbi:MAG: PDZ domain-containing protein [Oscillospiraceae bacterium]|jgi:carboxyl-terminal processing protease|nr:PDZ domain-containing protein [Oscillospiraceae bacterium]